MKIHMQHTGEMDHCSLTAGEDIQSVIRDQLQGMIVRYMYYSLQTCTESFV